MNKRRWKLPSVESSVPLVLVEQLLNAYASTQLLTQGVGADAKVRGEASGKQPTSIGHRVPLGYAAVLKLKPTSRCPPAIVEYVTLAANSFVHRPTFCWADAEVNQ